MFGKRDGASTPTPTPAPARPASKGKQAYEARRAEKAGVGLERWMADKERRARAEREAERDAERDARRKSSPEKPGLLRRLLDRAHRPL